MKKAILIFLVATVVVFTSRAQNITGQTPVNVGDQFEYAFTNGSLYMSPTWATQYGSVVSTRTSGTTYYATIQWNTPGTGNLAFLDQTHIQRGSLSVTCNLVAPNTTFTIVQNCNSTQVTRNTSPPTGVAWYWQTSTSGTSTTNSTNTYAQTVIGSLYLRAQWTANGTWSSSSQSAGATNPVSPLAPPATATDGHYISNTAHTVPVSVSTVASATAYWWYTQSSGGTAIAGQSTTSYSPTLSATQIYYVASVVGNCPSTTRKAVTANLYAEPVVAATNSSQVTMGRSVTLSVSNMTYDTYAWLDASNNTMATTPTYTTAATGNYNVKVTKGTSAPFTTPTAKTITDQTSQNINFIVSNTILVDNILTETSIKSLPVESNGQSIQYFDGLGRPIQTVVTQGSPQKFDLVQPVEYDAFGREVKKYLPYVSTQTNGWYKTSALSGLQSSYYATPPTNVAGDATPYANTIFDDSPLNRVLKQGAPGTVWQPDTNPYATTTDHAAKMVYQVNVASEVYLWTYRINSNYPLGMVNDSTSSGPVYYAANQLTKTKSKDADQHEIVEFKDLEGHTILRQVQSDSTYAETYFIYDKFDRLVCVIPPSAVTKIKASASNFFNLTDAAKDLFLKKWAYRYVYDARHRMIMKQLPGADYIAMVYDKRDRLVMTQDGNQRNMISKEWMFIKYDMLNRPVLTGKYASTNTPAAMQTGVDAYYDNLTGSQAWFETYAGLTGIVLGYSNNSYPSVGAIANYYTVSYYDQYDTYIAPAGYMYGIESPALAGQEPSKFDRVTGMATGAMVKNLVNGAWMRSVNYYDGKGRTIQLIGDHQKGTSRLTNIVDFAGRPVMTKRTYVVNAATTTIKEIYDYDHAGRVITVKHSINGASDVMIIKNSYNELGQLVDKNLHSTDFATFKQSVDYRYNIRGWLTKINEADVSNVAANETLGDYFGMEMVYDGNIAGLTTTAAYNGNISGMKWSKGDGGITVRKQAYSFGYDVMNRLKDANHFDYETNQWNSNGNGYGENLTYDQNGNIRSLQRKGFKGIGMDALSYYYDANQLKYVNDTQSATDGFVDVTGTSDYTYDYNGNVDKDVNKGIATKGNIKYNYLNLPQKIIKGTDSVRYVYSASGQKLAQEVYTNGTLSKVTDYIGELVFEGTTQSNGALKFMQHGEGRVLPDGAGWEYQYHLKDHLGNVRVTFTAKTQTTTSYSTDFEAASNANFQNYTNTTFDLVDHTDAAGTTYQKVQLLNGGTNGRVGLARSFPVMPGDQVTASAYCKYMNLGTTSNPNALITSLASAFGVSSGSTGEQLKLYNGLNSYAGTVAGGSHTGDDSSAPKVFATILFFDKNYNLIDAAWDQVSTIGAQTSPSVKQPPHDLVTVTAKAPEAGYAYVFLSNEHYYFVDTYFDDATFSTTPSAIVSTSDYFPFGLSYNTGERQGGLEQKTLYNSKELQDELSLNWYDYGARMYMPEIGRWGVADPLAEKSRRWTPYRYAFDNPLRFIDPDGMEEGGFQFVKGAYGENIEVGQTSYHDGPTYNSSGEQTNNITVTSGGKTTYHKNVTQGTVNQLAATTSINASDMRRREASEAQDERDPTEDFWFIPNESEAYRFMLAIQNLPGKGKEIVGVLSIKEKTGEKGVLILPWAGNKYDEANPGVGYHGSYYEDFNGDRYTPLAIVHTHPEDDMEPSTKGGDLQAVRNTYQIPAYILGDNRYRQFYPTSQVGNTFNLIRQNNPVSLFPK